MELVIDSEEVTGDLCRALFDRGRRHLTLHTVYQALPDVDSKKALSGKIAVFNVPSYEECNISRNVTESTGYKTYQVYTKLTFYRKEIEFDTLRQALRCVYVKLF